MDNTRNSLPTPLGGYTRRRAVAAGVATAMLAAGLAFAAAAPASAGVSAITNNGVYTMTLSGQVMSVQGASLSDGAALITWPSATGGENQKFELRHAGVYSGLDYYNIVSRDTYNVGGEAGKKCLDVTGGSTVNGAAIIQYTCNGGDNQKFQIYKNSSNLWALQAKHSLKYVGVSGSNVVQVASAAYWDLNKASLYYSTTREAMSGAFILSRNYNCPGGWHFTPVDSNANTNYLNGNSYNVRHDNLGEDTAPHKGGEMMAGVATESPFTQVEVDYWHTDANASDTDYGQLRLYCEPN